MATKPCIDIVLATYNGERFVAQQISSLQNCRRYAELVARVIVVDDGSSDQTPAIIARLQQGDQRIEWHVNPGPLHGPCANFNFGLSLTTADYIMLCDQDDIWHANKIARSFQAISTRAITAREIIQAQQPVLVFSDKRIVDQDLNELCPSFFQLRNISRQWHHCTESLLQQNVASGCTMLFNRQLLQLALPIPPAAFMHDWWLILVAKLNGEVVFIDEPLIDYRQHSNNSLGAKSHTVCYLIFNFFSHFNRFEKNFWHTVRQAEALSSQFSESGVNLVPFTEVRCLSYGKRLRLFLQGDIRQHSWKGQIALLLTLLKGYR